VIDQAMRAASEADLFLSVGTSLQVYPVAGTVELARSAGARIVIVNAQPTPFDSIADAVFNESISAVLPQFIPGQESAARSLH
jgi:NAD-dependent deacetylase